MKSTGRQAGIDTDLWNAGPAELAAVKAEDLLRMAHEQGGDRAAIGTSLQKTGVVMIDMASRAAIPLRVFFIDTLMNHEETYRLLEAVERRYGIAIERFEPDPEDLRLLRENVGQWAHFLARDMCCEFRKTRPLRRALETLDIWIAGLRADQSEHRADTARKRSRMTGTGGRQILKLNPLLDWTAADVDEYIRCHDVPCNALYDYESPFGERYHVIGCKPCHIPVKECFGRRAGKFPWEGGKKECGLHKDGGGI